MYPTFVLVKRMAPFVNKYTIKTLGSEIYTAAKFSAVAVYYVVPNYILYHKVYIEIFKDT